MVTTHDVEQRLRRTMQAMADAAEPADLWPDLTARLAAVPAPARLPEAPMTPRRGIRRPVVAFAVAFAMVIATLGVGLVLHPFDATEPGEVARVVSRNDLAWIPLYRPPEMPAYDVGFTNALPDPITLALVRWADGTETHASSGIFVREWVSEETPDALYGAPADDGFWENDRISEAGPMLVLVGQRGDGSYFAVQGIWTDGALIDRDLVRDVARAIRDAEPLPPAFREWVDVTPAVSGESVDDPMWYFTAATPDHVVYGTVVARIVDPRLEVAKAPWACSVAAVGTVPAAWCWGEGGGTMTWQIADGVAATVSSYDYPADELMAVAESMVLMSPDDPRFPPEE